MDKRTEPHVGQDAAAAVFDTRIVGYKELPTPDEVIGKADNDGHARFVAESREKVQSIMMGEDDRLMVVCGPCSIHDPEAALEYASRLKEAADRHANELFVVMRVYFEKPRTRVGWKGLINDPGLDGTFDIKRGLVTARRLLNDINALGLPCGTEFLDTITPQYISDTVTWGAIGARTTESQIHRELASGLSCPVGFKNGTDGNIEIAVDAVYAARQAHHFLAVTTGGGCAIAETTGNAFTHMILRGGGGKTNYDAKSVDDAARTLGESGGMERLMIDCSHANSGKDYRKQPEVAADIAGQVAGGDGRIFGVMVESNLVEGKQPLGDKLTYGQSVTDGCLGWDGTEALLQVLADAVGERRRAK